MKALLCLTSFLLVALVGSALVGGTAHLEIGVVCVDDALDLTDGADLTALTYEAMEGAFEGAMVPVADFAECTAGTQPVALETSRVDGDPASAIDAALFTFLEDVDASAFDASRLAQ